MERGGDATVDAHPDAAGLETGAARARAATTRAGMPGVPASDAAARAHRAGTARARTMKNLPPSMTPRENPSGTGAAACCPRTRRSVANDAHAVLRASHGTGAAHGTVERHAVDQAASWSTGQERQPTRRHTEESGQKEITRTGP